MSTKLPIAAVDIIPHGFHFSDLVGKPLKKLEPLLSSFKETRNGKPLKIIFFLEDEYEEIYLRSDDLDDEDDADIFHDLVDAKTSPYSEEKVLIAKTFPDAILDGDSIKMVIRINIGGNADTNIDLDNHGSTMARILRQSYGRHDRMVQSAIQNQHKKFITDTILNPQHSQTNATGQMEK